MHEVLGANHPLIIASKISLGLSTNGERQPLICDYVDDSLRLTEHTQESRYIAAR